MTFGNRKFTEFLGAATVVIIAEYILVLADSVIAGRVLGETALGAMNVLMPVFSTVSFFTWLLAVGTSIVYSDSVARLEKDKAAKIAGQGLVAAILMGMVLVVATKLLEDPYLAFLTPTDSANWERTMVFADQYWKWYPVIVILESVDMLLLYLVYTDGGELACLFSYGGQVIINIACSYGLCAGVLGLPKMEMAGISFGTVLAYVVGIAALLPRLFSRRSSLLFRFAFLPREFFRSLKSSFGDASAGLFHALLFFVITKYVLHYWGAELLPITAVVFCIVRLTVFFNGVGIALQPLETVYHGEGNHTGVNRLVRFAAGVSFAEGILLSAIIFIAPELIIGLVGIENPELVASAKHAARLTVTGLSGYAIAYMLNSHFQYVGKPGRSVLLTALAFFVMPVALLVVLGALIGMDGVWIAVAAGPVGVIATFIPVLKRDHARAKPTLMWSFKSYDAEAAEETIEELDDELLPLMDESSRLRVTDVLTLALKHLSRRNKNRIHIEISLKVEEACVKLIVRDDGELIPLEGLGVEVTHLPTAGFNRNVFAFERRGEFKDADIAKIQQ